MRLLAVALLLTLPGVAAADRVCGDWLVLRQGDLELPLRLRLCHELNRETGEITWHTLERNNTGPMALDASGDVCWSDGKCEHFWALIEPGKSSDALCTECRRHYPAPPTTWKLKELKKWNK